MNNVGKTWGAGGGGGCPFLPDPPDGPSEPAEWDLETAGLRHLGPQTSGYHLLIE